MPGFIHNFTIGLRISFGSKQVYTEIENLSSAQCARLSLIIALFRDRMQYENVPGSFATLGEVVQHPMAYRREICYTAFCLLKDIREASREKIRSYAAFKILPSPEIKKHTEICDLALSLLMCTIGVAYNEAVLETVRYSWNRVASYPPIASDVALLMSMPEDVLSELRETPLETEKWLELARSTPDFLQNSGTSF